jgi:hypothetical protein
MSSSDPIKKIFGCAATRAMKESLRLRLARQTLAVRSVGLTLRATVLIDEYGEGSDGKDHAELYREFLICCGAG